MSHNLIKDFLKKPLSELMLLVGSGHQGSPFEYALQAVISYKLQLKNSKATWAVALISIAVSIFGILFTYNQFLRETRAYIGLESLENISKVDSDDLNEEEGSTKSIFTERIKNYGNSPAYFEMSFNKKFTCLESSVNQIMPGQSIQMHCERDLGTTESESENLCDIILKEEIKISYGPTKDNLMYKTILRMKLEDIPETKSMKKLLTQYLPNGCNGNGPGKNIQWYISFSN